MSWGIYITLMLVAVVVIIEDDRIKQLEHDMDGFRALHRDELEAAGKVSPREAKK